MPHYIQLNLTTLRSLLAIKNSRSTQKQFGRYVYLKIGFGKRAENCLNLRSPMNTAGMVVKQNISGFRFTATLAQVAT